MVGVEGFVILVKEIIVKYIGSNVYVVNYVFEDLGIYVLKVLWVDKYILGSFFYVIVWVCVNICVKYEDNIEKK